MDYMQIEGRKKKKESSLKTKHQTNKQTNKKQDIHFYSIWIGQMTEGHCLPC